MAKKKPSARRTTTRKKASPQPQGQTRSQETNAEEELQFAREQLHKAEEYYEEIKVKAAEQAQILRETTLGDVVDGVLRFVKKHPGAGITGAAAFGFLFGRITRR